MFDLRFLRNPHYDGRLWPFTRQDACVVTCIEADPASIPFRDRMIVLLKLLLPRCIAEGKKYIIVELGCVSCGHRFVSAAEHHASHFAGCNWNVALSHRELSSLIGCDGPCIASELKNRASWA